MYNFEKIKQFSSDKDQLNIFINQALEPVLTNDNKNNASVFFQEVTMTVKKILVMLCFMRFIEKIIEFIY